MGNKVHRSQLRYLSSYLTLRRGRQLVRAVGAPPVLPACAIWPVPPYPCKGSLRPHPYAPPQRHLPTHGGYGCGPWQGWAGQPQKDAQAVEGWGCGPFLTIVKWHDGNVIGP